MKGHLMESLDESNSWVEFQVEWKGYDICNVAEEWVPEKNLNCEAKVSFSAHPHSTPMHGPADPYTANIKIVVCSKQGPS
jgi:hypothetical protein